MDRGISNDGMLHLATLELPGGRVLPKYRSLYPDPVGIMTIGIGHVPRESEDYEGVVLSDAEVWDLFGKDIEEFEQILNATPNSPALSQQQYDACVCFLFNIGGGGWSSSMSKKALVAGRFPYVPIGFFEFTKGGGERLEGLAARRYASFLLWHWGRYRG